MNRHWKDDMSHNTPLFRQPGRGAAATLGLALAALTLAGLTTVTACSPRTQAPTEIGEPASLDPDGQAAQVEAPEVPAPGAGEHLDPPAVAHPAPPEEAVRFVGTEPGYAVLVEGNTLTVTGEVHEPWTLEAVERNTADGHFVIRAADESRSVHVAFDEAVCNDGMSDVYYPWTATVTIDGAPHHGCGATVDNWPTVSFILDGRPVNFDAPCVTELHGTDLGLLDQRPLAHAADADTHATAAALDLDGGETETFLLRHGGLGSSAMQAHSIVQRCEAGGFRVLLDSIDAEEITVGERREEARFADLVVLQRQRGSAGCDAALRTVLAWDGGLWRPASITCAPGGPSVWDEACGRRPPTCP